LGKTGARHACRPRARPSARPRRVGGSSASSGAVVCSGHSVPVDRPVPCGGNTGKHKRSIRSCSPPVPLRATCRGRALSLPHSQRIRRLGLGRHLSKPRPAAPWRQGLPDIRRGRNPRPAERNYSFGCLAAFSPQRQKAAVGKTGQALADLAVAIAR